jgi:cyclopropane-fatty-acyl-phospholipid synthase
MVMHAAQHHGVHAVGVTLSRRQAEWARRAAHEAGLDDRVEIRVQDYRDVHDGPFDAVSSIGMFEHVGAAKLDEYFSCLFGLVRPGGRLLNHGISRPANRGGRPRFMRRGFIDRYVFPDGELHEIGSVVSRIQKAGFEARHVEGLREHYALTLRSWVRNLERSWSDAVAEVGEGRARVWRLYMAASAVGFEDAAIQIHQVLAVRAEKGASGFPLRPDYEPSHNRARPLTSSQSPRAPSMNDGARVRGPSGGRSFSVSIVPLMMSRVREQIPDRARDRGTAFEDRPSPAPESRASRAHPFTARDGT